MEKEEILEEVKDKLEKERTLKLSVKEGCFASVMTGAGTDYITPFALTLNASNTQIGFLSSFTGLVSPLSQVLGSRLMEKYSRKRLVTIFVALQALMFLPLIFLAILLWRSLFLSYLPIFLIAFYSIFSIFGSLASPAWFSLMGDIVPEKIRGRYWSSRNRICGTVALIVALAASFFLDLMKTKGLVILAFSILFSIALIFRLISATIFSKHYDPKFKLQDGYYFSFWQFIKKAPQNNFGKFVIFVALMQLATAISGPFFSVYMLKYLGFSYKTFMIVNISATISTLIFLPLWGKFSDKYGNKEMLKIGAFIIPLVPILWIVNPSPVFLALIPQLISGIGWAAFNLAASNFIYDSVTPQRRGICLAYHNILVGIGVFIGAALGGILAGINLPFFSASIMTVFLVSFIARFLVSLMMLNSIKEVKPQVAKPKFPLLYFRELNPVKGVALEISHDLRGIKKLFSKRS